MAINKVEFGGETLIDLTEDSVTPETLMEGETAHNAAGEQITGTAKSGGSVQSDWNVSDETDPAYVKNRTHYKTVEVSDTLFVPAEMPDVYFDGPSLTMYKVSDVVITPQNCPNGVMLNGDENVGVHDTVLTAAQLESIFDNNGNGYLSDRLVCVVNTSTDEFPAPEPGIYIASMGGIWPYTSVEAIGSPIFVNETYIKINKMYIPGNLIKSGEGVASEVFNGLPASAAPGVSSHAEGTITAASGDVSHAEGYGTTASGAVSHAEGDETAASGDASHAEGYGTTASGYASHAEGDETTASGDVSHAEGCGTTASNFASHAQGKFNKTMTNGGDYGNTVGDAMVIGNGTGYNIHSNAFRVTYAGETYGLSAFNSSGADYAEFFEWADFNPNAEDRVGYFVTLDGKHIRIAKPGDYILGIVSGQPCIIGNSDEDWLGRWEHDEFGRFIKEDVETPVTERRPVKVPVTDKNGNQIGKMTKTEMREVETGEVIKGWRYKANPDYDPTQLYIERKDRQEWDCVGMLGVLSVRDDGTCKVNGFCSVADGGIATEAVGYVPGMTYRVIERVSDGVVKVVFR